jgi:small-conductance mechanosensitive channel
MTVRPVTEAAPTSSAVYVSTNARPHRTAPGWQAAVLTVLAAGAAALAATGDLHSPNLTIRLLAATGTAAFLITGTAAVLRTAAWLCTIAADRLGHIHASMLRILAVLTGAAAIALTTLTILAVPVAHLLLGGAFTGALLGIAGQQILANIIAGIVLLTTRAIAVGDRIRLHNGTLGGAFEGTITELGLIHLHLRTTKRPRPSPTPKSSLAPSPCSTPTPPNSPAD